MKNSWDSIMNSSWDRMKNWGREDSLRDLFDMIENNKSDPELDKYISDIHEAAKELKKRKDVHNTSRDIHDNTVDTTTTPCPSPCSSSGSSSGSFSGNNVKDSHAPAQTTKRNCEVAQKPTSTVQPVQQSYPPDLSHVMENLAQKGINYSPDCKHVSLMCKNCDSDSQEQKACDSQEKNTCRRSAKKRWSMMVDSGVMSSIVKRQIVRQRQEQIEELKKGDPFQQDRDPFQQAIKCAARVSSEGSHKASASSDVPEGAAAAGEDHSSAKKRHFSKQTLWDFYHCGGIRDKHHAANEKNITCENPKTSKRLENKKWSENNKTKPGKLAESTKAEISLDSPMTARNPPRASRSWSRITKNNKNEPTTLKYELEFFDVNPLPAEVQRLSACPQADETVDSKDLGSPTSVTTDLLDQKNDKDRRRQKWHIDSESRQPREEKILRPPQKKGTPSVAEKTPSKVVTLDTEKSSENEQKKKPKFYREKWTETQTQRKPDSDTTTTAHHQKKNDVMSTKKVLLERVTDMENGVRYWKEVDDLGRGETWHEEVIRAPEKQFEETSTNTQTQSEKAPNTQPESFPSTQRPTPTDKKNVVEKRVHNTKEECCGTRPQIEKDIDSRKFRSLDIPQLLALGAKFFSPIEDSFKRLDAWWQERKEEARKNTILAKEDATWAGSIDRDTSDSTTLTVKAVSAVVNEVSASVKPVVPPVHFQAVPSDCATHSQTGTKIVPSVPENGTSQAQAFSSDQKDRDVIAVPEDGLPDSATPDSHIHTNNANHEKEPRSRRNSRLGDANFAAKPPDTPNPRRRIRSKSLEAPPSHDGSKPWALDGIVPDAPTARTRQRARTLSHESVTPSLKIYDPVAHSPLKSLNETTNHVTTTSIISGNASGAVCPQPVCLQPPSDSRSCPLVRFKPNPNRSRASSVVLEFDDSFSARICGTERASRRPSQCLESKLEESSGLQPSECLVPENLEASKCPSSSPQRRFRPESEMEVSKCPSSGPQRRFRPESEVEVSKCSSSGPQRRFRRPELDTSKCPSSVPIQRRRMPSSGDYGSLEKGTTENPLFLKDRPSVFTNTRSRRQSKGELGALDPLQPAFTAAFTERHPKTTFAETDSNTIGTQKPNFVNSSQNSSDARTCHVISSPETSPEQNARNSRMSTSPSNPLNKSPPLPPLSRALIPPRTLDSRTPDSWTPDSNPTPISRLRAPTSPPLPLILNRLSQSRFSSQVDSADRFSSQVDSLDILTQSTSTMEAELPPPNPAKLRRGGGDERKFNLI